MDENLEGMTFEERFDALVRKVRRDFLISCAAGAVVSFLVLLVFYFVGWLLFVQVWAYFVRGGLVDWQFEAYGLIFLVFLMLMGYYAYRRQVEGENLLGQKDAVGSGDDSWGPFHGLGMGLFMFNSPAGLFFLILLTAGFIPALFFHLVAALAGGGGYFAPQEVVDFARDLVREGKERYTLDEILDRASRRATALEPEKLAYRTVGFLATMRLYLPLRKMEGGFILRRSVRCEELFPELLEAAPPPPEPGTAPEVQGSVEPAETEGSYGDEALA